MTAKGRIQLDRERCKGCHLCLDACPFGLIEIDPDLNRLGYQPARFKPEANPEARGCTGCALCALVCPEVAIEVDRAR
ncbi:MAG: 4Fe-4S binding protein [Thermodesulfobacteriota bacterium]